MTSFAPRHVPVGADRAALPDQPVAVSPRLPRPAIGALVPLCYLLAATLLTWRLWADPASRVVTGNPHDADVFAWFMRYAATAIRHGRLPALVTTGMNAPVGVNLMWNTPMLLVGSVLAPVTGLFGPQVSLTVLTTVGFAGSATAMFWVLRRWGVSTSAASLGGAVYGFSPALLQSALSHYNLQLAVLPPLIIDAGLRLAIGYPAQAELEGVQQARPAEPLALRLARVPGLSWLARLPAPVMAGSWLGLLVAAQLFIGEEIALSTAMAGVLMLAVLAVARPRDAIRRAGPAVAGLLVAAAVTVALAGQGLWTQFHGPLTQHGALYPADYYVNDLTSFVTPQGALFFHTAASAATAARYQGGAAEYLGYLGWPLIALLVLAAAVTWRRPAGRAVAITCAVLYAFSLGGHPLVGGTSYPSVDLPWHWIEAAVPVLAVMLPDRLSIVADGAAAVLLALGIDAARARLARWQREPGRAAARLRSKALTGAQAIVLTVAVLGCLPLLPRPLPASGTLPVPAGWTEVFARLHLAAGTRVLVVPVPFNYLTPALRWSADTGEPTVMIGGYFIGPGAGGQPYINGTGIKPTTWYLDELWAADLAPTSPFASAARLADLPTASAGRPAATPPAPTPAQVRADLAAWRPGAVVANATLASPLGRYLVQLFGPPSVRSGGMLGWRR